MNILYGNIDNYKEKIISAIPVKKPYFHPEYCSIVSNFEQGGIPWFFLVTKGNSFVYYQFVKRDIGDEIESIEKNKYFDIITPFDYGGYYYNDKELLPIFFKEFQKYCIETNIISEFIRFYPLGKYNFEEISKYTEIQQLRNLIAIEYNNDFTKEYTNSRKRGIKKANERFPLVFEKCSIDNFMKIYYETMDKNGADKYYYFKKEYLQNLQLLNYVDIWQISLNNIPLSSLMILIENNYIYSYLGGSLNNSQKTNSYAVLTHEIAKKYSNENKMFILGGGKEQIYQFKKRFAKNKQRLPYYIGTKIYNSTVYNNLTNIFKNDFFPEYRKKII